MLSDTKKTLFIEIVCTFMCQFLSSVRIVEHIVPEVTVNKFVANMNELKEILGTFGTSMIDMEHVCITFHSL